MTVTHIRAFLSGPYTWRAACGVENPPSSISLEHHDAIRLGYIAPFGNGVTICRACILTVLGPAPDEKCGICGHMAKRHALNRCRAKQCGCGGFIPVS